MKKKDTAAYDSKEAGAKTRAGKAGRRSRGRLLTILFGTLVAVGVGVIAYPFALIALHEYQKNEEVAQLERELPIHRAEEDFEALDEAALDAMPVVPVPQWSTEEVLASLALFGEDQADLIGDRPTPQPAATPSARDVPRPTEIPQPGVRILYEDPGLVQVRGEQQLLAALPNPSSDPGAAAPPQGKPDDADGAAEETPAEFLPAPDAGSADISQTENDPRTSPVLRDAAPVFYEDFADILWEAAELRTALAAFQPQSDEKRAFDSPTALTVASIKHQVASVENLRVIFQALPSASTGTAAFQNATGTRWLPLWQGSLYLAEDLGMLDSVMNQMTRLMRFPRARDLMQSSLDRSVALADRVLNLLDYMALELSAEDLDRYRHSRASLLVRETEALYLLDLPSINLRVGCFPNVTFEQMYTSMRKGAALFPRVGTPNTNTNISMMCHRTGSAAFFKNIDRLKTGDTVLLHTRGLGSFRYIVEQTFLTDERDWTPLYARGVPTLTLISCDEYNGLAHGRRIMTHCKLIGIAR